MSDGGRGDAPLGVKVWKSSQKWSVQRSAVRSIAWLDVTGRSRMNAARKMAGQRARPTPAYWAACAALESGG